MKNPSIQFVRLVFTRMAMKKNFIILLLSVSFSASAQMNCPSFTRYGGFDRWEISPIFSTVDPYPFDEFDLGFAAQPGGEFKDHSLAAGVIVKFFTQERIALRVKGIYTRRYAQNVLTLTDTAGVVFHSDDEEITQALYKIAPGFQWTFFDEHLSFYGGFDIPFTYHGELTQTGTGFDSLGTDTAGTVLSFHRVVPGGYSIGLGIFGGSTYYFTQSFGAGFEISAAYQYTSVGGEINATASTVSGNTTGTVSSSYFNTKEYFRFTPVQAAIFLTLRF